MFRLTSAEAQIARLVGNGLGPAAIAKEKSISTNTARTHLSRLVAKAGISDQVALCSLFNRLRPPSA